MKATRHFLAFTLLLWGWSLSAAPPDPPVCPFPSLNSIAPALRSFQDRALLILLGRPSPALSIGQAHDPGLLTWIGKVAEGRRFVPPGSQLTSLYLDPRGNCTLNLSDGKSVRLEPSRTKELVGSLKSPPPINSVWKVEQNKDYGKQVAGLAPDDREELKQFRETVVREGLPAAERKFPTHPLEREWKGFRALTLGGRNSRARVIYKANGNTVEINKVTGAHDYSRGGN